MGQRCRRCVRRLRTHRRGVFAWFVLLPELARHRDGFGATRFALIDGERKHLGHRRGLRDRTIGAVALVLTTSLPCLHPLGSTGFGCRAGSIEGLRLTRCGRLRMGGGKHARLGGGKTVLDRSGSSSSHAREGGRRDYLVAVFRARGLRGFPMRRPCVANLLDERGQGKADDDGSDEHDPCKDDA